MIVRVLIFALLASLAETSAAIASDPHTVLENSMRAAGGAALLRGIHSIEYTAVGERQMVEQSERPSGPYFIDHFRLHQVNDFAADRARLDQSDEAYAADVWWTQQLEPSKVSVVRNGDVTAVVTGGKWAYGGRGYLQDNQEQFALSPERVLQTADAASDLRELPDRMLHGVRHHVLAFHWKGAPCTLAISADTGLPWQITYTRPYPYETFLNAWGDVTTEITYNAWSLEPYGISYPREWTYRRIGLPDRAISIVALHINPELDASALTIPRDIVAAHPHPAAVNDVALGAGGEGGPREIAPGVTQYPGGWNVTFVKEPRGTIVIEAPWSTGYTQRALDAARKAYGAPVIGVVTTSDSWPHIAGVRQAVADGIPIYALDLNRPILDRLLRAPHAMLPDDLQRRPRTPHFIFVSAPLTLGTGENRLTIYPYRTATAERQMMVYFPGHRLLYTSDLFAPNGGGTWFTPQYLHEAIGAIQRYGISPLTIFGMHYGATPYATIVNVVENWRGQERAAAYSP